LVPAIGLEKRDVAVIVSIICTSGKKRYYPNTINEELQVERIGSPHPVILLLLLIDLFRE